jgi:hypothetical protein
LEWQKVQRCVIHPCAGAGAGVVFVRFLSWGRTLKTRVRLRVRGEHNTHPFGR